MAGKALSVCTCVHGLNRSLVRLIVETEMKSSTHFLAQLLAYLIGVEEDP